MKPMVATISFIYSGLNKFRYRAYQLASCYREEDSEELQNSYSANSLNFATFIITDSQDILKNSWILDGGSDIHICNNSTKWQFQETKKPQKGEFIHAGNTTIPIESYGTVKVMVDTPNGKRHITLYNISLAHGFLTNIVSMQLLNTSGFNWNSRNPTRLECEDYSIACNLYQEGGHILFNNPHSPTTPNVAMMARLAYDPKLPTFTEESLHRILSHANQEVISQINGPEYGINIDTSHPVPKTTQCVPCSLAKAKNIISRRTGSEIPRSG
ncbi:hypothetical protein K3495_g6889 [Podosphaera aphanis]|nr:hypothetical protein K3495_g6889 [Podosphaera aphanis]